MVKVDIINNDIKKKKTQFTTLQNREEELERS